MAEVALHGGGVALMDDGDLALVEGRRWYRHSQGYVFADRGESYV